MADTDQIELEAQPEAIEKPAPTTRPPEEKAASEAPEAASDPLAVKQGESAEAYAARIRSEISWRDKQIHRQHRQKKEYEEKLAKSAEIEAENRRLAELAQAGTRPKPPEPAPVPQPQRPTAQPAPSGLSQEALAQARFQIGVEKLGEQLNNRPEWKSAAKNLEAAGGVPPELVSIILDTDDPAHVMIALGNNPEKYQKIIDMPEGRRRAALYKMGMEAAPKEEAKAEPPKRPSAAPAPRDSAPAGGASPPEYDFVPDRDDRVPQPPPGEMPIRSKYASQDYDDSWYARRAEQKRNSQNRPWSPSRPRG